MRICELVSKMNNDRSKDMLGVQEEEDGQGRGQEGAGAGVKEKGARTRACQI